MRDLFPGYDVLSKRDTPSWNTQTRAVIEKRLDINAETHRFFNVAEWRTLTALCRYVIPQPSDRQAVAPLPALLDHKLAEGNSDGYRHADMPPMGEAWRRGLAALDLEARRAFRKPFDALEVGAAQALISDMAQGSLKDESWGGMACEAFFKQRVLSDLAKLYYGHPTAWNEIGWGGPASPRGYVRMDYNRRDPWEAAEAKPGEEEEARRKNLRVGR